MHCEVTGKVRYENVRAITAVMRGTSHKRKGLSPYRCPRCGGWHIGTKPRGKKGNQRQFNERNRRDR